MRPFHTGPLRPKGILMFAAILDQQLAKHSRAADRKRVVNTVDGQEKIRISLENPPASFADSELVTNSKLGVIVSRVRPYGNGNATASAVDTIGGEVAELIVKQAGMNEAALAESTKAAPVVNPAVVVNPVAAPVTAKA